MGRDQQPIPSNMFRPHNHHQHPMLCTGDPRGSAGRVVRGNIHPKGVIGGRLEGPSWVRSAVIYKVGVTNNRCSVPVFYSSSTFSFPVRGEGIGGSRIDRLPRVRGNKYKPSVRKYSSLASVFNKSIPAWLSRLLPEGRPFPTAPNLCWGGFGASDDVPGRCFLHVLLFLYPHSRPDLGSGSGKALERRGGCGASDDAPGRYFSAQRLQYPTIRNVSGLRAGSDHEYSCGVVAIYTGVAVRYANLNLEEVPNESLTVSSATSFFAHNYGTGWGQVPCQGPFAKSALRHRAGSVFWKFLRQGFPRWNAGHRSGVRWVFQIAPQADGKHSPAVFTAPCSPWGAYPPGGGADRRDATVRAFIVEGWVTLPGA